MPKEHFHTATAEPHLYPRIISSPGDVAEGVVRLIHDYYLDYEIPDGATRVKVIVREGEIPKVVFE